MNAIFEQITGLLTNPPGSLAFFLVIVFCVSSVLQIVLMILRHNPAPQQSRLLTGILLVLSAQLILFIATAMTWQMPQSAHIILPALDRALPLFSLVLIAWLWAFPLSKRSADIATIIIGALILVLGVFTYLFWSSRPDSAAFNSSQFDLIWNIVSIVVTLASCLSIWWEKQEGWAIGVFILLLNLTGYIFHFIAAAPDGDLAAAVRLTQLITFPFLPLLAQRLLERSPLPEKAWPLITRLEEDELDETPPSFASLLNGQNQIDNSEEIRHLNTRLDQANTLLTEAHNSITQLQEENIRLNQSLMAASKPAVVMPSSGSPASALQKVAQKMVYPLNNISRDAVLVRTEGIGLLSNLQRTFVDEIINTASTIRTWLETLERYPQNLDNEPLLTDFNSAIDTVIAGMNTQIRAKSIALRFDIGEIDQKVYVSQKTFEQILIHLLKNALEVSPADATIDLNLEAGQDETGLPGLLVQMSDSGGGVAPKNIDKIFNLPPQGSQEPRYRGIGSITSLRLAKTMVNICGGKIWLESKNKQTTYFVFFPF